MANFSTGAMDVRDVRRVHAEAFQDMEAPFHSGVMLIFHGDKRAHCALHAYGMPIGYALRLAEAINAVPVEEAT